MSKLPCLKAHREQQMLMQLDKLQENNDFTMNNLPSIQEDLDGSNEIEEQFRRFSVESEDEDREDEEGISIQLHWDMT